MTPPDHRADPFTASDEAFFQAGHAPARELTSERPVTLDAEEPSAEDPSAGAALAARRARFVRPVRSTLIALGVLATLGLLRHVWRTESAELAAGAPAFVHTSANAAPATDVATPPVTALFAPAGDDAPLLATTLCDGSSSSTPLGGAPLVDAPLGDAPLVDAASVPSAEATLFGPPAPPDLKLPERASHRVADHVKAKPLTRGPSQRTARPPHPLRRAAPVTKAALLHALRSS